jgi:hypothetical protein
VPQYVDLSLSFSWKDLFWASKYQEKLRKLGSIELFDIHYQLPIGLQSTASWDISLCAVPSEHAHSAKQGLVKALPALKAVLAGTPKNPDHFRWKAFYDLAMCTVCTG